MVVVELNRNRVHDCVASTMLGTSKLASSVFGDVCVTSFGTSSSVARRVALPQMPRSLLRGCKARAKIFTMIPFPQTLSPFTNEPSISTILMRIVSLFLVFILGVNATFAASKKLGEFEGQTDIGEVASPGTLKYDAKSDVYTVGGSGENMWFDKDEFHYVWKMVSGDLSLAANIEVQSSGDKANAHRKAVIMIRQSLEGDSVYADIALHGDKLTSLQFRDEKGGITREIRTINAGPKRLRLEKKGNYVYMSAGEDEDSMKPTGSSVELAFSDPYYVGIGVCAHDNANFEYATFSNVEFGEPTEAAVKARSAVETLAIASGDRTCIFATENLIEAPNWTPDGENLILNGGGLLYRLPIKPNSSLEQIDTGLAVNCNNDHGISPDGTQLVVSDSTEEGRSVIYTLPFEGGKPKRVTDNFPSYWHGWSPDGRTLAYCADRGGNYDVYTISVDGGEETRLTDAEGLDDGPDFSPDGEYIYFNSVRTGLMQIYRMKADGSEETQLTFDEANNWFPHPSPDGRWLVYIAYEKEIQGHPRDKDVNLRLMDLETGESRTVASFFGGQGTINVPSWSPDSTHIAYVRYQPEVDE